MVNVGKYTMHGCYGHDGQVFVGTFCVGSLIQPFPWKSLGIFLEWLKNSLYPAPHTDPVQMSNEKKTGCLGCIWGFILPRYLGIIINNYNDTTKNENQYTEQ